MRKLAISLLISLVWPFAFYSQNVGIGTNNPQSKLHVAGCIRSDTLIGVGVRNLFAAPNGRIYDSLVVPSTVNWQINGNSNITPANFLGTTNAQDVIFKTNNTERTRILTSGQVGIGTPAPNASAIVEISSANLGVLFPKMTTAQRNAIAAPAIGLMVYDLTANILMSYNGTRWQEVGGDPIGSIEAFHKSMANTPALPWGWVECNGQVLSDPESPYNGQAIPDLNNTGLFLRGGLTSGASQAADIGPHTHTGTTSTDGSHNHTGSTGSVNSTNGRIVPWDDNLATDKMNAANTAQLGNTPVGGGGIPWDGLATVGNFITTIDQLDHTHAISTDGSHNHTFTTAVNTGVETRPANMSMVWIIRVK